MITYLIQRCIQVNDLKIEIMVNDSEMNEYEMKQRCFVNTGYISPEMV